MRKTAILVLAIILLSSLTMVFAANPAPVPKTIKIAQATVNNIDGVIDSEWNKAAWSPINGRTEFFNGNKDWTIDAKVKILWDSNFLYVAVEVKDNEIGTFDGGSSNTYAHDGITMYLREGTKEELRENYENWSGTLGNTGIKEKKIDSLLYDVFGHGSGTLFEEGARGATIKHKVNGTTYTVEFKIPFITPKSVGDQTRFALLVTDYDDAKGNRVALRGWNSTWWAEFYATHEWAYLDFVETVPSEGTTSSSKSPSNNTSSNTPSKTSSTPSINSSEQVSNTSSVLNDNSELSSIESSAPMISSSISSEVSSNVPVDGNEENDSTALIIIIVILSLVIIAAGLTIFYFKKIKPVK